MTRFQARLSIWKRRLLCRCSKSYRDLDNIVSDRERWRREAVVSGNELAARTKEVVDLLERLKTAIQGQESATSQLIAERALRQTADTRADRYHQEYTEALKASANWATQAMNRRSMFGGIDAPAPELLTEPKPSAIRPKPMARQVANDGTHATLKQMLEDIRAGSVPEDQLIGPEFTTQ